MIDPSHATGKSEFVLPMTMAAIAAGTDSMMIEVHPNPAKALSDGPQSLTLEAFDQLMQEMAVLGKFFGRWTQNNHPFTTPKITTKVATSISIWGMSSIRAENRVNRHYMSNTRIFRS